MRVLQIVESAYRATLEEQDDTIVWFTRTLRAGGADVDLLLIGSAASYAVRGQDASGLTLGGWTQRHPPAIERELDRLLESGARVAVVHEDLADRGIATAALIPGIETWNRKTMGHYFSQYDKVWKW